MPPLRTMEVKTINNVDILGSYKGFTGFKLLSIRNLGRLGLFCRGAPRILTIRRVSKF